MNSLPHSFTLLHISSSLFSTRSLSYTFPPLSSPLIHSPKHFLFSLPHSFTLLHISSSLFSSASFFPFHLFLSSFFSSASFFPNLLFLAALFSSSSYFPCYLLRFTLHPVLFFCILYSVSSFFSNIVYFFTLTLPLKIVLTLELIFIQQLFCHVPSIVTIVHFYVK